MGQTVSRIDLGENIVCHQVYMGEGVKGFVYLSKKGTYHIFITDTLCPESQAEVLAHEMHHIKHDLPSGHYFIGLDAQGTDIEIKANNAAKRLYADMLALITSAI